jgi:hypothetical protein
MSTAAVKWIPGRTARRRSARATQREPAGRTKAAGQTRGGCADLTQARGYRRAVAPRPAVARVEHALFALTLGTVVYLWLVQATGGF